MMKSKRLLLFSTLILLPLLVCQSQIEYRTDWPGIADLDTAIAINALSERIHFELPLKGHTGKTLYTIFCRGGSTEYLDSLCDRTGVNYCGALCFFLVEGSPDETGSLQSNWNLLCEDGSAHWYSRGQIMDYSELVGACGDYPEYGNLRHFRLRGLELTFQFKNITADDSGRATSFIAVISAHPDSTVTASITEQTGYLTPRKEGRGCDKVLRGNEPRSFRNERGLLIDEHGKLIK
jgi:hypothetical protein